MSQHTIVKILAACIVALFTPWVEAQAQVTVELAQARVPQFAPVFVAVRVANPTALDLKVLVNESHVRFERADPEHGWVRIIDPAAHKARFRGGPDSAGRMLRPAQEQAFELMSYSTQHSAVPGRYRVRVEGYTSRSGEKGDKPLRSDWVEFSVSPSAANAEMMSTLVRKSIYEKLLAYGVTTRDGRLAPKLWNELSSGDVESLLAFPLEGAARDVCNLALAAVEVERAETAISSAARLSAVQRARALLAQVADAEYAGPIGGAGAQGLYLRALAEWYAAERRTDLAQGDAYYSQLNLRYPIASSAYRRVDGRALRPYLKD